MLSYQYNTSMKLMEIDQWIRSLLPIDEMSREDISLNGIQVGQGEQEIRKAAFAVDACQETFARAAELGADLLVVHHGLFWGKPLAVTGSHYERLRFLMEKPLSLYAAHLPLDMDEKVGNNIELARLMGLEEVLPFGSYHGKTIGFRGSLPQAMTLDEILLKMWGEPLGSLQVLPFGPEKISSVGIVSGGAPRTVSEALDRGLDLFITGDASHEIYHEAQEGGINVIFGGHYWTEIWGVRALARRMESELAVETLFVDVPTGL